MHPLLPMQLSTTPLSLNTSTRAKNVKNQARVNVHLGVEELTRQLQLAKAKIAAQVLVEASPFTSHLSMVWCTGLGI